MNSIFNTLRAAMRPGSENSSGNPQRISAEKLKNWLDQEVQEAPLLLDVRTPEEHRQAHIPGSRLLPVHEIPQKINGLLKDKRQPVVVYCASGARSSQAARYLASQGFEAVYDLGGIFSWPYPVTR